MGHKNQTTIAEELASLRKFTDELIDFDAAHNHGILTRECDGHITVVGPGDSEIQSFYGVYKVQDCAILHGFSPAGSSVPRHAHSQREWIGIIHGKMRMLTDRDDLLVEQYDAIFLEAGKGHSAFFLEDTHLWAVTMPAALNFPEPRRGCKNETE
jgi:hypothetical protein